MRDDLSLDDLSGHHQNNKNKETGRRYQPEFARQFEQNHKSSSNSMMNSEIREIRRFKR